MMALIVATSCGGLPEIDLRGGPVVFPAGESLPGGSGAKWRADYQRLAVDIPRAVRNCDWALLRVQVFEADAEPVDGTGPSHIDASALLPNERRALVSASPEADGVVRVVVRVGQRGDATAERRFLKELARVLRGAPAREYHGRFKLPD